MADDISTSLPPPPQRNDQTAPAPPRSNAQSTSAPTPAAATAAASLCTLPETLTPPDRDFDCPSFSELLEGITTVGPSDFGMVFDGRTVQTVGIEGKYDMSPQLLASVSDKVAQAQAPRELQTVYESPPVTHSDLSVPNSSPIVQESLPGAQENGHMQQVDQENSNHGDIQSNIIMETPTSDRYNWRKYGQKQVKSSESSRSYYRCTHSNCHAKKKVQRCDHSGCVIEIIYKGEHNHDPPPKIRFSKLRKSVSFSERVVGCDVGNSLVPRVDDLDSCMSRTKREPRQRSPPKPELEGKVPQHSGNSDDHMGIKFEDNGAEPGAEQRIKSLPLRLPHPECKRRRFSSSSEIAEIAARDEQLDDPRPKQRMKKGGMRYSVPLFKTVKEPKIVIHAASDVGVSGDGYRWRKYGQKVVKGSPYPRSYYRCTSAGCPVRKHVERATEDTVATIITYEGKHDHDMPVPKKRHGPPSSALLVAAVATMNNVHLKKSETTSNEKPLTDSSVELESDLTGEKALELEGEKALESARTLLSIGIELRPC